MGVVPPTDREVERFSGPGDPQYSLLQDASDEFAETGFIVSQLD